MLRVKKLSMKFSPPPAAGPPTHAIAGTRARAVTMATVRPPSLLNHSRRLASCRGPCATTLSSLDAAVVTRRRRQVTSFAFPSGGARQRARLYTSNDSLSTPRPTPSPTTAAPAPSMQTAPTPDCGPRFQPLRPCAPRRATGLPTPIATMAAPARVPPGPGRQHVGPDHRLMW